MVKGIDEIVSSITPSRGINTISQKDIDTFKVLVQKNIKPCDIFRIQDDLIKNGHLEIKRCYDGVAKVVKRVKDGVYG